MRVWYSHRMGNAKGVRRDFNALARRRMKAVRLFERGLKQAEVGRRAKVPRQTAHRWYQAWVAGGEAALKKAGRAGRKARITKQHRGEIVQALVAGPRANGFASDVWTLPRVAQLVERLTGIKYHPDHMSRLMRDLGWSCQRPAARAKERNEAAIAKWRKEVWTGIKKKPKKSGES